ncbi:MAG: S49 family peptidase [Paracoccus sp. (in: a-proteobacteria)]|nr:S49 family peptidase [Paracoccus sp. (in: a-proteobacteria)]
MKIPFLHRAPRVAVLRLHGVIAAHGRGALSDAALAPMIERAFARRRNLRAVAMVINSPGGSPVQSSLIASRIRRLADRHEIPVHAFVEDVAGSGGYWLATAADQIWCDPASILGSIGVVSAGFGFHELLERHGVERRLYTAGQSKSLLDPFKPERPEDVARLRAILEPMHVIFKEQVRTRRGARLAKDRDLFTGDIWIGQQAVDLGLADGIAHLQPKMRALYGDDIRFSVYGVRQPFLRRLGLSAEAVIDAAEEAAAFARFGAQR